ncbi:Txe/YoeB family addiction module toxin [Alcanivorax jadensis T9]|uniref:Putative mRNA interferase YoeB n=1 Tax=Alcanivorax jadensis T9 TaxID=1177181 RepID=A0ABR4WBU4_9GAMM|nr:Txe/YoeB family addiction module toxin [Alcanivorax jadensis]KGD60731.1 Txe/YoeB family addiction module toxin [Alcanivorax jadensis T9]
MSQKKQKQKPKTDSTKIVAWTESAWNDYLYWQVENTKIKDRIDRLITESLRTPFHGIGKPEPLKANLSGFWSRRIDNQHRFIYAFLDGELSILSCRYHY